MPANGREFAIVSARQDCHHPARAGISGAAMEGRTAEPPTRAARSDSKESIQ
jgi:hypothetical protein